MSGEKMGLNCEAALARVFDYLDAEMTPAERDLMQRHLENCSDCDHEMGLEVHLRELVRRSCCDQAPAELRLRIVQQISVLRTT